jgi:hypothetical protein
MAAEHVSAHQRRADIGERLLDDGVAVVDHTAFVTAPGRCVSVA